MIPCLRVSPSYNQGISQDVFSSGDSMEEESTFKFIQVIGRIHLLAIIKLRAPAFCWLSAQGHAWILEAGTVPSHVDLLHKQFTTWQLVSLRSAAE